MTEIFTAMRNMILVLFFALFLSHKNNSYAVENITVLGLFKDKAIVVLDGKRRTLSKGETSPEEVKLISANSNEVILEINGQRNSYTLGAHIGSSYKKPVIGKTVTVPPDEQGMYQVNGSINGFQAKFVIDTGATLISMNKHEALRFGLQYKLDGKQSFSSTASGLDKIYIIDLKKVRVGEIELTNIKGAVHDGDFPNIILLGNSFLNRVDLRREGRVLTLEKKQ